MTHVVLVKIHHSATVAPRLLEKPRVFVDNLDATLVFPPLGNGMAAVLAPAEEADLEQAQSATNSDGSVTTQHTMPPCG